MRGRVGTLTCLATELCLQPIARPRHLVSVVPTDDATWAVTNLSAPLCDVHVTTVIAVLQLEALGVMLVLAHRVRCRGGYHHLSSPIRKAVRRFRTAVRRLWTSRRNSAFLRLGGSCLTCTLSSFRRPGTPNLPLHSCVETCPNLWAKRRTSTPPRFVHFQFWRASSASSKRNLSGFLRTIWLTLENVCTCVFCWQCLQPAPTFTAILPLVHIRAAALDLIAEELVGSDCCIAYAQALAGQLWDSGTACEIVPSILEVLPRYRGLRLVAFISANYSLLQTAVEQQLGSRLVDLCRPDE